MKGYIPALLCVLYTIAIFSVSSIPGGDVPGVEWIDMSLLHIPMFFILSYLIFRTLERKGVIFAVAIAIILSTLYGVFDEIHQIYVPGRDFSTLDIFLDFFGSSIIVFKVWHKSNLLINFRGRIIRL